jgi:hypothetical protein
VRHTALLVAITVLVVTLASAQRATPAPVERIAFTEIRPTWGDRVVPGVSGDRTLLGEPLTCQTSWSYAVLHDEEEHTRTHRLGTT